MKHVSFTINFLRLINIILIIIALYFISDRYYNILEYVLNRYIFYSTISLPYSQNKRNLLLYSNSTMKLTGNVLGYGWPSLKKFLEPHNVTELLFVPYAWPDVRDGIDTKAATNSLNNDLIPAFSKIGIKVKMLDPLSSSTTQQQDILNAQAIYMCGGNTFWLTRSLHENNVISTLRYKINNGMPYIGASAGTNVVCPTMQTTNDMPNCCIPSCETLGIIPFQINVHYNDWTEGHGFAGESRKLRLCEYLQENRTYKSGKPTHVLGLREGSMLHVSGDKAEIVGLQSRKPVLLKIVDGKLQTTNINVGSRVDELLKV